MRSFALGVKEEWQTQQGTSGSSYDKLETAIIATRDKQLLTTEPERPDWFLRDHDKLVRLIKDRNRAMGEYTRLQDDYSTSSNQRKCNRRRQLTQRQLKLVAAKHKLQEARRKLKAAVKTAKEVWVVEMTHDAHCWKSAPWWRWQATRHIQAGCHGHHTQNDMYGHAEARWQSGHHATRQHGGDGEAPPSSAEPQQRGH